MLNISLAIGLQRGLSWERLPALVSLQDMRQQLKLLQQEPLQAPQAAVPNDQCVGTGKRAGGRARGPSSRTIKQSFTAYRHTILDAG